MPSFKAPNETAISEWGASQSTSMKNSRRFLKTARFKALKGRACPIPPLNSNPFPTSSFHANSFEIRNISSPTGNE